MILQPFEVVSGGTTYRFLDAASIDSDVERAQIQTFMAAQLELSQQDAMCAALGIDEVCTVGNLGLGVYDGATLIGVLLVASLAYQSGPWADLTDWEVTNGDPAVFHARPMPGFPLLSLEDSLALSVDAAHHLLAETMTSANGHNVEFTRLSWGIYKDRGDANSRAAKRVHDEAAADARFAMTETADPDDAERTLVYIELV